MALLPPSNPITTPDAEKNTISWDNSTVVTAVDRVTQLALNLDVLYQEKLIQYMYRFRGKK